MKQYIIGKNIYEKNPNIPILWLTYKDYKYIKFTIKFLKKNSELKQGFKIFIGNDFVGNVIVDGKEIFGVVGTAVTETRDPNETYYEMKRTDYLRRQMGLVGVYDLPTEEEYLEQQTYVNTTIETIMGVSF